ncbi:MAG: Anti-sigma-K factor rskA [Verrucomicrobiales bacterium]|nr:Anti-sigma-K factor rskA [Verrucomicrobiales bacterium]
MDDSLSENAALYVLGLLTGDEQAAFERALQEDPALAAEVRTMTEGTLALAASAPQVAPPPDLRAQLLAAFQTETDAGQVPAAPLTVLPPPSHGLKKTSDSRSGGSPPQAAPRLLHLLPWAAAAVLGVMFAQQKQELTSTRAESSKIKADNVSLTERERHYLDAIRISEAAKAEASTSLASTREALEKAKAGLEDLNGRHSTLVAELNALRQDSQLDKTRIAVLGSLLENSPKAVAVSLWRQETQQGLLVVENLPALPPGRDYQLWVIDPSRKIPVSAGVFKVDVDGKVRLEFKPVAPVREASKFAVTVEREGGSPTPDLKQLVVIGG